MNIESLSKKRKFSISKGYDGSIQLQFVSSNINTAREAHNIFKNIGAYQAFDDVNGGRSVGGYYASGSISQIIAQKLKLI